MKPRAVQYARTRLMRGVYVLTGAASFAARGGHAARTGAAPGPSSSRASETGVASWYGPGFHGQATASGEPYDQNAMTAAHRTLPLGTRVRVTNLDNRRTVQVRVNDRGPFVGD